MSEKERAVSADEYTRERLATTADAAVETAWYHYRTPAYERGEFRGKPNRVFRDGFVIGVESARSEREAALIALRDRVIAGIRGDDQDRAVGMIAADFAGQIVREEFEVAIVSPAVEGAEGDG